MTTQITSTGFERDRLDVIFASYQAAMRAIFGADINVDPDSLDGQMLGIFAEGISNEDQLAEAVYNSFNPSLSFGAGLSRLVQINGIRRIAGAYSSVIVTFTGVANTVIPSGTLVSQDTVQTKFSTTADATIGAGGTVSVACLATEFGAIIAAVITSFPIDNVPAAEIVASPDMIPLSAVATCDPVNVIAEQVT